MENIKIEIGESFKTAFSNDAGVFQDGTVRFTETLTENYGE